MKNILSILACCILVACSNEKKEEVNVSQPDENSLVVLTDKQLKNADLQFGTIEKKSIAQFLTLNGRLEVAPTDYISVNIPLGGSLKSTQMVQGMPVRKGEVIAKIEDIQLVKLQQDYLTTKNTSILQETAYNRQKQLNSNKATSDREFEQAKADYLNTQVLLKSYEEQLRIIGINPSQLNSTNLSRSIAITSPIDGYVAKMAATVGSYLQPNEQLVELVNTKNIHATLTVFEKDIEGLSIGQKVSWFTNTRPDKKYAAKVQYIGRKLSQTNTVEVVCQLDQQYSNLLPGTFVNATVDLSNRSVNALPEDAVVRFQNKSYVFVEQKPLQYKIFEVKTGAREEGYIEIKNGENLQSQKIVTQGAYNLLMVLKNISEEE